MIRENIRRLRVKQGISQRELARMIKMSGQMISKIEKGETSPSLETLEKISSALGVTLNDLFEDIENSFSIELITAIEKAYINKNDGSPVNDVFQALSDDLGLDYEMFDCFSAKTIVRKLNDNGKPIYEEIENEYFDRSKELPIDIQSRLLIYLYEVDYPTFRKFIREHIDTVESNPVLFKCLINIKRIQYLKELAEGNPNDKEITNLVKKYYSTGEFPDENIEVIQKYKRLEHIGAIDQMIDKLSIAIENVCAIQENTRIVEVINEIIDCINDVKKYNLSKDFYALEREIPDASKRLKIAENRYLTKYKLKRKQLDLLYDELIELATTEYKIRNPHQ